ncbi:MAG: winged helix-turn-helix transcriptional regulator [Actinobacteria bacterium]|nr:MAG: winged helix-turn-helix transcriptional regulator [Actinomycetota bacterium]
MTVDASLRPMPASYSLTSMDEKVTKLKALADPTRLALVARLQGAGTASVLELVDALGAPQPTVSHHLRVLREAGIVTGSQRGKWVDYRLVDGALEALAAGLVGRNGAGGRDGVELVRVVENGRLGGASRPRVVVRSYRVD